MTTINPHTFADLIGTHAAVELIDVRPRAAFEREHIRGARSIPLSDLHAARIVQDRGLRNSRPLFLVCDGRLRASLAAGLLRGAGCLEPVVMEGGMESWRGLGLPTLQPYGRVRLWLRRVAAALQPGARLVRPQTASA
jgi:rhodanese-related sulfurtransferase